MEPDYEEHVVIESVKDLDGNEIVSLLPERILEDIEEQAMEHYWEVKDD